MMLTRCPDCHTVYRVSAEQLQAAGGRVRCGQCAEVFDARREALAAPVRIPAPGAPPSPPARPHAPPPSTADAAPSAPAAPQIPPALHADFEPPRPRRSSGWWVAALVLSLTLAVQYVYYMRARLAADFPQWRPTLVQMCALAQRFVPCSIPLPRNLSALQMLSSAVTEHPQRHGLLTVQATFVNTADHAQRFPLLEVQLSDVHGRAVALRRFEPSEYLPGTVDHARGLAPRTPVSVSLEVLKPGADVSSFALDFL